MTADGGLCSGSLLDDASSDYRQFFLTASHCGTPSGWNVVFDFESATCARGGASSLANQVGNIVEVARNDLSDFCSLKSRIRFRLTQCVFQWLVCYEFDSPVRGCGDPPSGGEREKDQRHFRSTRR